MEVDEAPPWVQNKLAMAISRLSLPTLARPRDFQFYNNFLAFKSPVGAGAICWADDSLDILGAAHRSSRSTRLAHGPQ
jgi:exosome complex exonuclease RRP6